MGDYFSMRFKGTVKSEYRKDFEGIAMRGRWKESKVPMFREFGEHYRAMCIPCGGLCYSPLSWTRFDSGEFIDSDGFHHTYDAESGYWTFQCSIRDDEPIWDFFTMAPLFLEHIEYAEWAWEYWDYAYVITMGNGEKLIEQKVPFDGEENLYILWKEIGMKGLLARN